MLFGNMNKEHDAVNYDLQVCPFRIQLPDGQPIWLLPYYVLQYVFRLYCAVFSAKHMETSLTHAA